MDDVPILEKHKNALTRLIPVLIGCLVLCFALQAVSPLRLNGDSITLLSMAASAADGDGFLVNGIKTHFPIGYPALVAFLDHFGLANSMTLVLLNLVFYAAGLFFSFIIFRTHFSITSTSAVLICCISAVSYVFIKHVTLPMSESVFFGLFTASLWSLLRLERCGSIKSRVIWLTASVFLIFTAILVRTAGIALLPALGWAIFGRHLLPSLNSQAFRKPLVLSIGITLLGIFFLGFLVKDSLYLLQMHTLYGDEGIVNGIIKYVGHHLVELGEIIVNAPSAKLSIVPRPFFLCAGIIVLFCILHGMWLQRPIFSTIEMASIGYLIMIFAWPFTDARFWLPLITMISGYLFVVYRKYSYITVVKTGFTFSMASFSFLGIASLIYVSLISLSNDKFADRYGDGSLSATYKAAFFGEEGAINERALRILRRFDFKTRGSAMVE